MGMQLTWPCGRALAVGVSYNLTHWQTIFQVQLFQVQLFQVQLHPLANYFPVRNTCHPVFVWAHLTGGLCSCSGSAFPPLLPPRVSQVWTLSIPLPGCLLQIFQPLTFAQQPSDGCWRREESARQGGPTKLRYKNQPFQEFQEQLWHQFCLQGNSHCWSSEKRPAGWQNWF